MVAVQSLARLYQAVRLFVNYFQPSFKLRSKTRDGARVSKTYYPPATPCDRLLHSVQVTAEGKRRLTQRRAQLDPIRLLHTIRELQVELLRKSGHFV